MPLMDSLIDSQGVPQAFIASSLPVLEGAIEALADAYRHRALTHQYRHLR